MGGLLIDPGCIYLVDCFVESVITYSFQGGCGSHCDGPTHTLHSQVPSLAFLSGPNLCFMHLIDISLVCMCKHVALKILNSFM